MSQWIITPTYETDAGKLGRHNLSFKTGAHKNRRQDKKHLRRKEKATIQKKVW